MKIQNQTIPQYMKSGKNNGLNGYSRLIPDAENNKYKRERSDIKVLMYHRIVEDRRLSDTYEFCVHIQEFGKQLEILAQLGFTPITFNDYLLFRNDEIQLPRKPVIITFDDGYLDTYSNAYPLLIEYGMRAVIFVLGNRSIRINSWDLDNKQIPIAPLMEDHHIKELHAKGFEIGVHTLIHSNLQYLSETDAYKEILNSRIVLQSLLGVSVMSFSYPFGSVNERIKKMTQEAGYEFGCGVFSGPARFGDDLFDIRRLPIHNKISTTGFIMRLEIPVEYAGCLWWKVKKVRRAISGLNP